MRRVGTTVAAFAGASMFAMSAYAQEQVIERAEDALTARPLTLEVGAGLANTTQGGAKQFTDPGAMWTVRGIWGAASVLGIEGAYVGSAQSVENLGTGDALLVRNGLEALARVGMPFTFANNAHVLPYAAAGLGWAFYNVAGEEDAPAGLRDNDNVFTTPIGVGVAGGLNAWSLDLRFMFRPVYGDELFRDVNTQIETAGLNTLTLSAAVGYTF